MTDKILGAEQGKECSEEIAERIRNYMTPTCKITGGHNLSALKRIIDEGIQFEKKTGVRLKGHSHPSDIANISAINCAFTSNIKITRNRLSLAGCYRKP